MTVSNPRTVDASELREYTHAEVLEVMTGLLAALFTAMISTTIVSTALPTLMADLGGTQRQYTWVITSSLLAMTITTPLWGKLSDLFNKKMLTQIAIVLFVAGSVLAGLSTSVVVMMTARAVQGLAMGGLMALTQSIMATIIAPRQRGRYAGYMGAVMAVATVSGPLLGGLITDGLGWRWCFFVSVPLAVVALVLLQLKLQLPTLRRKKARFDYAGAVLVAIGAALPMVWVTFAGSDYDWISWESGAFLLGFLVIVTLVVIVELRAAEPVIPIRVLRNGTAVLMIIASIGAGVAMFGSGVFLTQYFQLGAGVSPTEAGLMTIPLIIAQMLSSMTAGQIVTRTGRWKLLMLIGSATMLVGLFGLGTINHTTPYGLIAVYMVLMGIGIGALVQNVVLAVQNVVDVTEVGAASAAVAFFRSLGGAVGVTVLGAILTVQVAENISSGLQKLGIPADAISGGSGETQLDITGLPAPVQEVFHHSYSDAFGPLFLTAGIIAITSFLAILLVRETPLRMTVMMKPKDAAPGTEPGERELLDAAAPVDAAAASATATIAPREDTSPPDD